VLLHLDGFHEDYGFICYTLRDEFHARDRKGAIMRLGATLYLNGSVEAVDFYTNAFGLVIGYNEKNLDGTYLHAELTKDDKEIFAVSESPRHPIVDDMLRSARPTMSYGIDFDDDASLKHAYETVIEGGHVLRPLGPLPWNRLSADVVDRFGVYWYICLSSQAQVEANP
jgi:PhnB protein